MRIRNILFAVMLIIVVVGISRFVMDLTNQDQPSIVIDIHIELICL